MSETTTALGTGIETGIVAWGGCLLAFYMWDCS